MPIFFFVNPVGTRFGVDWPSYIRLGKSKNYDPSLNDLTGLIIQTRKLNIYYHAHFLQFVYDYI